MTEYHDTKFSYDFVEYEIEFLFRPGQPEICWPLEIATPGEDEEIELISCSPDLPPSLIRAAEKACWMHLEKLKENT